MRRLVTAGLTAFVVTGCNGIAPEAEAPSVHACGLEVAHRTGKVLGQAEPPWRITSHRQGDGYQVNVWTNTPRAAQRPAGSPNYVCVTKRDRTADNGVRLVEVRP